MKYFDHRVPFRGDAEFGMEHLNGIYVLRVLAGCRASPAPSASPVYLARTRRASRSWLREQPEVMHVYSYADIIKRLNKNMHGDAPEWLRASPEERELAAQYLLLYELSLPYGLDLNDRISESTSPTTRVSRDQCRRDLSTVRHARADRSSAPRPGSLRA